MKKVIGLLLFIILIFLIINFNNTKILILNNIDIWLKYIVVSIGPTFIISNLLYQFPFVSFLLYPLLKKIMHFENQKACSLFLISILTGNPTTSILISNAYHNKEISLFEANRLLSFTSHVSFIFIINFFGLNKGIKIIKLQILSSIIISIFYKNKNNSSKSNSNSSNTITITTDFISKAPILLFNILIIICIVSFIKVFLTSFINNPVLLTIINFLELTTGLINFKDNFLLSNLLISFNGVAVGIQVFMNIKKTDLSFNQFLVFRFIHMFIVSSIILILFFINLFM